MGKYWPSMVIYNRKSLFPNIETFPSPRIGYTGTICPDPETGYGSSDPDLSVFLATTELKIMLTRKLKEFCIKVKILVLLLLKGTVSWKLATKAYVAIHHSIGLTLSIVADLQKSFLLKGQWVGKLSINFSALTAHLPLKVQGSFKVLSLACRIIGKRPILI